MNIHSASRLLVACCALLGALPLGAERTQAFLAHSEFWPAFVSLTRPLNLDDGNLRAGKRGVLLRLQDGETALVDFGRQGVRSVDVQATDFASRFSALQAGSEVKRHGNMVEMLAPRMLQATASGLRPLALQGGGGEAGAIAYFLFFYLDDDEAAFEAITTSLLRWGDLLVGHDVATVVMPLFAVSNETLQARMDPASWETCYMLQDFVASGYVGSLHHGASSPLTIVLTDKDGKLLYRGTEASFEGLFEKVPEFRSPL